MGAVYGVSLKYVALSGVAALGARWLTPPEPFLDDEGVSSWARLVVLFSLWHISAVNGIIALLFQLQVGMHVIGKDSLTGQIPLWSYGVFAGFHMPTLLYTKLHSLHDKRRSVPVATEVEPGWWVGGRYGAELGLKWAATIDLTCEFPEGCAGSTERYLLLRCWDGVPPSPEQLERAAAFAVAAHEDGHVMVHCAHGRGRSTTTMCACLVKAGLHSTWEKAFEAIKRKRNVCKLNRKMRSALTAWQAEYVVKAK